METIEKINKLDNRIHEVHALCCQELDKRQELANLLLDIDGSDVAAFIKDMALKPSEQQLADFARMGKLDGLRLNYKAAFNLMVCFGEQEAIKIMENIDEYLRDECNQLFTSQLQSIQSQVNFKFVLHSQTLTQHETNLYYVVSIAAALIPIAKAMQLERDKLANILQTQAGKK